MIYFSISYKICRLRPGPRGPRRKSGLASNTRKHARVHAETMTYFANLRSTHRRSLPLDVDPAAEQSRIGGPRNIETSMAAESIAFHVDISRPV